MTWGEDTDGQTDKPTDTLADRHTTQIKTNRINGRDFAVLAELSPNSTQFKTVDTNAGCEGFCSQNAFVFNARN